MVVRWGFGRASPMLKIFATLLSRQSEFASLEPADSASLIMIVYVRPVAPSSILPPSLRSWRHLSHDQSCTSSSEVDVRSLLMIPATCSRREVACELIEPIPSFVQPQTLLHVDQNRLVQDPARVPP